MSADPGHAASKTGLIDRCSDALGRAIAWLTLAMVIVTLLVVVLRYAFGIGAIWLQESITWMHALVFMLGASYALRHGDHVRVDVFYRRATASQRGWIDALGILLLLLPLCAYILYTSVPYVAASFAVREASREANGLLALFLLKAVIPLLAVLLALQALADLRRAVQLIRGR
ncbi:MAG: TRAP transporter small permease subunit [Pseudomonadales bacterium]|nr:TRAP transporter small permease subunit [Pseudomonadales bacterium]